MDTNLKIIIESNTGNALLIETKSFLDSPEGTEIFCRILTLSL